LAVWLLTATVSLLPIGLLVHLGSAGEQTSLFISQSPNHVLSVLASCYLYSLICAAIAEGLSRSRELRRAYSDLQDVQQKLSVELDELAASYSKPISERLSAFVDATARDKSSSPQSLAKSIFEFSGTDLRSSVSDMIEDSTARYSRRVGRRQAIGFKATAAFTKLSFSQSLGVFGTTLLAVAYFAPSYFLIAGLGAALAIGASLGIALAVWLLIALIIGERKARWWLWALFNGGIFFASVNLAWPLILLLGADVEESLVIATSGLTALLAIVLSSLESLVVRRKQLQEALVRWNESLSESSMKLNQRLSLVRSNVAKYLHNNVQSQLVALALKLQAAGDSWPTDNSGDEMTKSEALQILSKVGVTVEQARVKHSSFESSIAELQEFWQGALKITFEQDSEITTLLNSDASLNSRVLIVLRECLTNAAKHSVDGSVQVKLGVNNATVYLMAINKVSAASKGSRPTGVGIRTIQEATTYWAVYEVDGQYTFDANF
jgi:signal transduction histidine kinase